MTVAEFERRLNSVQDKRRQMAELEQARQEAEQRRAAWIVVTIMNFAGKQLPKGRKLSIDDVLKKTRTADDMADARRRLIARHRLKNRFNIC